MTKDTGADVSSAAIEEQLRSGAFALSYGFLQLVITDFDHIAEVAIVFLVFLRSKHFGVCLLLIFVLGEIMNGDKFLLLAFVVMETKFQVQRHILDNLLLVLVPEPEKLVLFFLGALSGGILGRLLARIFLKEFFQGSGRGVPLDQLLARGVPQSCESIKIIEELVRGELLKLIYEHFRCAFLLKI